MRKYYYYLFCFVFQFNSMLLAANNLSNDSIVEKDIGNLLENYLNLFTISDINGNYHPSFENRFKDLFIEDATIFNFLPETPKYHQNISINEFVEIVKKNFTNKIIRPGLLDFSIVSYSRLTDTHEYEIVAILNKKLLIYSKRNYEIFYEFNLPLQVLIQTGQDQNKYKIKKILRKTPGMVDLEFRVLTSGRELAKYKPVNYTYHDPVRNIQVVRRRFTNPDGVVFISKVPEDAELHIHSDGEHEVLIPVTKTAEQWLGISLNDRFFVLDRKLPVSKRYRPYVVSVSVSYPFPILSSSLIGETFHPFGDPVINLIAAQGLHLRLSRELYRWSDLSFYAGIGFENKPIRIKSVSSHQITIFNSDDWNHIARSELLLTADSIYPMSNIEDYTITEQYSLSASRIPLFLSCNYSIPNKYLRSIGFATTFVYTCSADLSYSYTVKLSENNTLESLKKHNNTEGIGNKSIVNFYSLNEKTGSIGQRNNISFNLELAFNFDVYKDIFHLQYLVVYNVQNIGNRKGYYKFDQNQNNTPDSFSFTPLLSTNELRYSNIWMGLGLMYKF